MTTHKKIAIIGGGIYGCGLLLQLVKNGCKDVILLEKSELTAGSTWHAAGFCTHYSFNPTHVYMRKFSTDFYHRLQHEGREPTGFHRCGGLRITNDPERMHEFSHGLSVGRQQGIEFEMLSPQEIKKRCPLLSTNNILGGIYEPLDGYVDPAQATGAMARMARSGGAQILRQSPVTSMRQTSSGEWSLETPTQSIVCEHIVIAAGFWSNQVGKLCGLDLPVTPMLHQYLVTEDHPDIKNHTNPFPLVRLHDAQWYIRREHDGLILGAYESYPTPQTWAVDGVPDEFGMQLMQADLDRIEPIIENAIEHIPLLAQVGIKSVIHGPVSYTPDGQPLIGPAPGLNNAWLACGSGFGIGEAAGAGKLLAEWMIEGQPSMHMGAFDPRRFGPYADRNYRIDKAVEVFASQFAIHYPKEEKPAGRPSKTSPIYPRLVSQGAEFGAVYGWERANWFNHTPVKPTLSFKHSQWFDAVGQECRALARHVGLIDLTSFSKFIISGLDAEQFLDRLSANRLPNNNGEIRLCYFLNNKGAVECEFTITRLSQERFYLVCGAAAAQHHMDRLKGHCKQTQQLEIADVSDSKGILAIAGPKAREILQPLCDSPLDNQIFPWLTQQQIRMAGKEVVLMRLSYCGELGWEIHHQMNDQLEIYDSIIDSAGNTPIANVGFYALNAMRMEKAYMAWGSELTVETNAIQAGLERFIVFKNRQFIGREALLEQQTNALTKRICYVELEKIDSEVIGGEAIFSGNRLVGSMISGVYGHRADKHLGFALLDLEGLNNDDPLQAEILGTRRNIRIITQPAYDSLNHRQKA